MARCGGVGINSVTHFSCIFTKTKLEELSVNGMGVTNSADYNTKQELI